MKKKRGRPKGSTKQKLGRPKKGEEEKKEKKGIGRPRNSLNKKRGIRSLHNKISVTANHLRHAKKKEKFILLRKLATLLKHHNKSSKTICNNVKKVMNYQLISVRAEVQKQTNEMFEKIIHDFEVLTISLPCKVSTRRFYGNAVPKLWVKNVSEHKEKLSIVKEKWQDLATIRETQPTQNIQLIFAQNSVLGRLCFPKKCFPFIYEKFFQLDKQIAAARMSDRLHKYKVHECIEKEENQMAVAVESEVIPNLIKDMGHFTIRNRSNQINPNAKTCAKNIMLRTKFNDINFKKEQKIKSRLKNLKIPVNSKPLISYPRMQFLDKSCHDDNDIDYKKFKPYFATSLSLKELPGWIVIHFNGTRNLLRVHKVIDAVENECILKVKKQRNRKLRHFNKCIKKRDVIRLLQNYESVHVSLLDLLDEIPNLPWTTSKPSNIQSNDDGSGDEYLSYDEEQCM